MSWSKLDNILPALWSREASASVSIGRTHGRSLKLHGTSDKWKSELSSFRFINVEGQLVPKPHITNLRHSNTCFYKRGYEASKLGFGGASYKLKTARLGNLPVIGNSR